MTLDTTARNVAQSLTDKFGKTATLRRTLQTAYDPSTGLGGADLTPVDYTVKVTPPTDFMLSRVDGTLIKEGDQVVSLPALSLTVYPDQSTDSVRLEVDGATQEWNIRQIGRLWSGELVAMYILHLTK